MRSVGDIAGLRPKRRRGDDGEVPETDVLRVDALDLATWRAAAGWPQAQEPAETRRTYLAALSGFLAWPADRQREANPPGLLQVTEDHLMAYKDDAGNGWRASRHVLVGLDRVAEPASGCPLDGLDRCVVCGGGSWPAMIGTCLVRDHGHMLAIGAIGWHIPERRRTCVSAGPCPSCDVDRACPL
ncbi:hypothetical protein ACTMTI_09535 [Nonomuraea sp. H19]|uniref:hypothetical protein n=1 Tax=Nonomuraea sp. H19 TaxID=3452206 RepID=UPI003F8B2155